MSTLYDELQALSDPTRVRLLNLLERAELVVGELARVLDLPQSTISRHLKSLLQAGWIRRRAQGTASYVRFEPADLAEDARALWGLVRGRVESEGLYADDVRRMEMVLAMRAVDGQGFFERAADRWDALRRELFGDAFLLPALLSLLPAELEVGDLGCGTGDAVAALAPHVRRVVGVDRERAMLERAAARTAGLANVTLRQGALDDLPIDAGALDAALCFLVLHHVEPLAPALREVARVLRAGGRLVIVDMARHDRVELSETMGHRHLGFDVADLVAPATAAGLEAVARRPLPSPPGTLGPPLFLGTFRKP